MRCGGCNRALEPGDRYIEAAASRYLGVEIEPEVDALMGGLLSGRPGSVVYCESCTQEGGDFVLQTYDGDDEDEG
jgi:hypothetical protein